MNASLSAIPGMVNWQQAAMSDHVEVAVDTCYTHGHCFTGLYGQGARMIITVPLLLHTIRSVGLDHVAVLSRPSL